MILNNYNCHEAHASSTGEDKPPKSPTSRMISFGCYDVCTVSDSQKIPPIVYNGAYG